MVEGISSPPQIGPRGRNLTRWGILVLLAVLAYPLAQTAEVHGAIVSNSVEFDQIIFAISADNCTLPAALLNVTLSVTGNWWAFYGNLTYDESLIPIRDPDDPNLPIYDNFWSETYHISGLESGWHSFTFEARYSLPWPNIGWRGPVTVSVLAYFLEPKPTFTLAWRTPLSNKDSFRAGSTIPIRFSVYDDAGDFKRDESVTVTVTNADRNVVFHAVYGTHKHDVRIRENSKYYIVYWKTTELPSGEYTISVKFGVFFVEPSSRSIWLR